MSVFIERIEALRASTDATDQAAAALLEKRGINQSLIDEVHTQQKTIQQLAMPPAAPAEDEDATTKTVDALWRWYQQWAEIARVVITSKQTRIWLGVSSSQAVDDEADDEAQEPTAA